MAEADGFLYKMVRSLVGALVAAGEGKLTPSRDLAILKSRERTARSRPLPPRDSSFAGKVPLIPEFGCHRPPTPHPHPARFMHFDKPTYSVRRTKKKGIPEGLYTKDPVTGEILFNKEIEETRWLSRRAVTISR